MPTSPSASTSPSPSAEISGRQNDIIVTDTVDNIIVIDEQPSDITAVTQESNLTIIPPAGDNLTRSV